MAYEEDLFGYDEIYLEFRNTDSDDYIRLGESCAEYSALLKPIFTICALSGSRKLLTKEELVSLHGRTGNILHARNPFGKEPYYQAYETQIPSIMEKIRLLLNCHQIQLLGEPDFFYLVHMKEARDDRVHYYKFARVERTP